MDAPLKKNWLLTREALDRLLARLDPDRERAAEKYEQIRQRLMKLFKWRGCALFEEYADQTIDRVARRLAEGGDIHTPNPYTMFYGVAMLLLKEHWRKTQRETEALEVVTRSHPASEDPEDIRSLAEERQQREIRLVCLRDCLKSLPAEGVHLIQRYYAEGNILNKEQRKQVADELKISVNALRVRAFRIRSELEQCVENCAQAVPVMK